MKKTHNHVPASPKALLVAAALLGIATASFAAPYACDLTNNSGVISFRLNENADNVKIISNGGATTNDLGAGVKGLTVTNLGISGVFQVIVTRSVASGYTLASSDSFQDNGIYVNKYEQARGIAVNKNPATPSFGRIFIADSRQSTTTSPVRTNYQGIYLINSDDTVALNTGVTPRVPAGITFAASSASPTRLVIGKDDNLLYMCDLSDPAGGLWYSDLDITTGGNALDHIGDLSTGGSTHGSIYATAVEGTLANGNLKIYTYDEDLSPVKSAWRYDVNSGPVPFTGSGTSLGQACVSSTIDMVKGGPKDYIYSTQNRNTAIIAEPSLMIFTTNGVLITNSLLATRAFVGNSTNSDLLRNVTALDMSPDGRTLALIRGSSFGSVLLLPLDTNGLFSVTDFTNTANSFSLGASASSDNNRDIAYDAAGNLYAINTASEWFRIYSRGGATIATTGSDGTFTIGTPPNPVTVTATVPNTLEGSATNAVFTFTRTGDVSSALTASFSLGGTATNGVDYTLSAGTVSFGAGQSNATVTLTPINNSIAQLTRTAVLTIVSGTGYSAGVPNSATVSILDDEAPQISITTISNRLLEVYSASKATYQLTRRGLLTPALTVNVAYLTPERGTDFNGPTTVSLASGVATTNFNITPINNNTYSGDRPVVCAIQSGSGYSVATPSTAVVALIDDEYPPGTVLFSDSFETDSSANWTVNSLDSGADTHADFAYDYSAFSIPAAPASTNTTKGLKIHCNDVSGSANNGLSVSPTGGNYSGDYRLKFDIWLNYNGPTNNSGLADGGHDSTMAFTAGLGTAGGLVIPESAGDGIAFKTIIDGAEGNVSGDYSAYANATLIPDESGIYYAGTTPGARDNFNAYYSLWGNIPGPVGQATTYPTQVGKTDPGMISMSWHSMVMTKKDETVTWSIDSIPIATATNADALTFTTTGNVFVGFYDPYAGYLENPHLRFAVVDNLKVETYVAPKPAKPIVTALQTLSTNIVINFAALPTETATNFSLVASATLSTNTAAYTSVAGSVITGSNGLFQATAPFSAGSTKFYLIKR